MYVRILPKSKRPKAHVVAPGSCQVHGFDYDATFGTVVKLSYFSVLLATFTMHDLELHQMDIVTCFLHGDLDKDIFMLPPRRPHGSTLS